MRRAEPRYPDRVRSDILWQIVEDARVPDPVRAQMREIARQLDEGRFRLGLFLIR